MYLPLHNRSAFSFGSSLIRPEELARWAVEHGCPAIGLTDRHGLYAAPAFQKACTKLGIRPIVGAEFDLPDEARLVLLARDATGYGHMCELVSQCQLQEQPPGLDAIRARAAGLVAILGRCPSAGLPSLIDELRDAFADTLYVELAIHTPEDAVDARRRARIADEAAVPVVAGGEARCLRFEDNDTLKALASIGTLTLFDTVHPDKPVGDWHLRTPEALARQFRRRPDALANTHAIAQQCQFEFDFTRNRFPAFESPDGRSAMAHLRERCVAGCRRRYVDELPQHGIGGRRPTLDEALLRLERELAVIDEVHYAEYFLVFDEINRWCGRQGIATLARGSAADSLVCYALGVSHACPFRFDLPFDRFLNPERARFSKMADIDLDLPWDERERVVRWVYDRWGYDHVAMIGSANTYRARAAVVELGKVFGLPPHEVHQVSKRLPWHLRAGGLADTLANSVETRDLPVADEPYPTILRMAAALEGLPHHWSMHPCGLVVSPEPLTQLVPVQRSPKGILTAQYEMDAIEDLGFIKIDLLGQAGLSVLRDSVAEINRTQRDPVNLAVDVDYADGATWDMIAGGGARGVHHIESPAMTSLIRQCNCRDIDGLTSIVAIIRPGAANQGKKNVFARRYQGFEPTSYVHSSLEEILTGTFGIMVFEEHILQVAVAFAGMNLGRADVLRRALNKQKRELVDALHVEFVEGARRLGRSPREIDGVWAMISAFSGFMFNKAHSAEYAIEAFQGAWLKRRWPAHYLAAVMSNYRGFYAHSPTLPQILYVLEAMRLGVGFLPPCVNRSRERFSVDATRESDATVRRPMIRVPVSHIKGLSEAFLDRYHEQRLRAVFGDLDDFVERCQPGDAESQLLLDSGALDDLIASRPAAFWQLRRRGRHSSNQRETLWHEASAQGEAMPLVGLTEPSSRQIARREMELLGFPIRIDPLTYLSEDDKGRCIDWSRYVPVGDLHRYIGANVQVCGLMVADRLASTQSGEMMKFVTLADRTGIVETYVFPDAYAKFGHLTVSHPILAAGGRVEGFENRNGLTLRLERVHPPTRQ